MARASRAGALARVPLPRNSLAFLCSLDPPGRGPLRFCLSPGEIRAKRFAPFFGPFCPLHLAGGRVNQSPLFESLSLRWSCEPLATDTQGVRGETFDRPGPPARPACRDSRLGLAGERRTDPRASEKSLCLICCCPRSRSLGGWELVFRTRACLRGGVSENRSSLRRRESWPLPPPSPRRRREKCKRERDRRRSLSPRTEERPPWLDGEAATARRRGGGGPVS